MLYPTKNIEELENLNELVSFENQVKAVRLHDNLGEPIFHEDMKKVFEPMADTLKQTSQYITKTTMEASIKNNQTIEILNEKILD